MSGGCQSDHKDVFSAINIEKRFALLKSDRLRELTRKFFRVVSSIEDDDGLRTSGRAGERTSGRADERAARPHSGIPASTAAIPASSRAYRCATFSDWHCIALRRHPQGASTWRSICC